MQQQCDPVYVKKVNQEILNVFISFSLIEFTPSVFEDLIFLFSVQD